MSSERSYNKIIDYLIAFAVGRCYDGAETQYPRFTGGMTGFIGSSLGGPEPMVGDLIRLESMHDAEFRLSWLCEVRSIGKHGDLDYLCQSIKTGKQCWWSNVGVSFLHRETLENHPEWKWEDEQHQFNDRWQGAANIDCDAYMWRPLWSDFNDDGSVTIGVRMRHGDENSPRPFIKLTGWEAIGRSDLANMYWALQQMAENQWKKKRESPSVLP